MNWVGVLRNDNLQLYYPSDKDDPVEFVDGVVIINGKDFVIMYPLTTIKNVVLGTSVDLIQKTIAMHLRTINLDNYWIPECPQPSEPCQVNS